MELGVQTHFSQGWSTSLLTKALGVGATEIRDGLNWSSVEKTAGVYNFNTTATNYLALAQNAGIGAQLTFSSGNALYDSGLTPYTDAGRKAFADYIVQVLTKFKGEVDTIEIWNEFNISTSMKGPAATDVATYYTALLKQVYTEVKPLFPDVKILASSTNVIGTGALKEIFDKGALNYMDGVSIHPYRDTPEGVDQEIQHLNDVIASYGTSKPIYATEFGNQFSDPAQAPDYMLKMVTLMASEHVAEASWYALTDESFFNNMGLFDSAGNAKPAAAAFSFIEKNLIPLGDPVKVDTGDPETLVYKFGANTYVMWGDARAVSFASGGTFYNSKGEAIAAPTSISMSPIIYKGSGFTLGTDTVVADTMLDYGDGVWQYFAKSKTGALTPLTNVDWDWTSYMGSKYTKPLRINNDSIAPAGDGTNPIQAVERYTSDKAQTLSVNGSWTTGTGDGVDLHILVNGKEIWSKVFSGAFTLSDYKITLNKGDTLDFAMGPNQYVQGDSTKMRVTLTSVASTVTSADTSSVSTSAPASSSAAASAASSADAAASAAAAAAAAAATAAANAAAAAAAALVPVTLTGTSGADTLAGHDGADQLFGGAGDDTLSGGKGDDTLSGGIGKNVIDGGDGFDTVSYADQTAAVKIVMGSAGYFSANSATMDKLVSIEGVIGSSYNDIFKGSAASESFAGGGGDDTIYMSGGKDVIDGGDGNDTFTLDSWTSAATVSLRTTAVQTVDAAGDTVTLKSIETLIGSDYNDKLTASDTGSTLNGGTGDDVLIGGAGNDILAGGKGTDVASYETATGGVTVNLSLTTQQDTIGAGKDTLTGIEKLIGSNYDDKLTGSNAADTIDGGAGNDVITGGGGADTLTGGAGADRFVYTNVSESKVGAYDTITDFSGAQGDKIDLSGIDASTSAKGDQAFAIAASFTKVAGQLTFTHEDGGWLVQGDTNGDGVADFGIHVKTTQVLSAADFAL